MSLPEPYYEDDAVTLYHGDCLSILPSLSAGFGVVVMDPPYGTRSDARDGWMVGEFGNVLPMALPLVYEASNETAALYCFSAWTNLPEVVTRCSVYFRQHNLLVWDKGRHSGRWTEYAWQFTWEAIFFGTKGPRETHEYLPDVLSVSPTGVAMQKPITLLDTLLSVSASDTDSILDPFAGTGSALVAAKNLGRQAIGIEIEERYCEIAAERLSQETLDLGAA